MGKDIVVFSVEDGVVCGMKHAGTWEGEPKGQDFYLFFFTGRKHMKQKMEIRNGRLSRYNISGNLCMSLAHYNAFTASAAAAAENTTQMFIYFRRIPCPFVSLSLCLSWGNLAQLERQQRRLGISLSLIANVAAAGLPPSRTAWQSGRFSKRKTREVLYM